MVKTVDFLLQLRFHFIVCRFNHLFLFRLFHDFADTLSFGNTHFFHEVIQYLGKVVGGLFGFGNVVVLFCKVAVQFLYHGCGVFHQLFHIDFKQFIELFYADVVACTAFYTASVVCSTGVGGF